MSFELQCPHCTQIFSVLEETFGQIVACPHCNENIQLAAAPAAPEPA